MEESYFKCEQWFELRKIRKVTGYETNFEKYGDYEKHDIFLEGVLIVNSYGKVRKVWEDGAIEEIK